MSWQFLVVSICKHACLERRDYKYTRFFYKNDFIRTRLKFAKNYEQAENNWGSVSDSNVTESV